MLHFYFPYSTFSKIYLFLFFLNLCVIFSEPKQLKYANKHVVEAIVSIEPTHVDQESDVRIVNSMSKRDTIGSNAASIPLAVFIRAQRSNGRNMGKMGRHSENSVSARPSMNLKTLGNLHSDQTIIQGDTTAKDATFENMTADLSNIFPSVSRSVLPSKLPNNSARASAILKSLQSRGNIPDQTELASTKSGDIVYGKPSGKTRAPARMLDWTPKKFETKDGPASMSQIQSPLKVKPRQARDIWKLKERAHDLGRKFHETAHNLKWKFHDGKFRGKDILRAAKKVFKFSGRKRRSANHMMRENAISTLPHTYKKLKRDLRMHKEILEPSLATQLPFGFLDRVFVDKEAAKSALAKREIKLQKALSFKPQILKSRNIRDLGSWKRDEGPFSTFKDIGDENYDSQMVASNTKKSSVKWYTDTEKNKDVHQDEDLIPSKSLKTIYARKLEYSLPTSYAVLLHKIYSSEDNEKTRIVSDDNPTSNDNENQNQIKSSQIKSSEQKVKPNVHRSIAINSGDILRSESKQSKRDETKSTDQSKLSKQFTVSGDNFMTGHPKETEDVDMDLNWAHINEIYDTLKDRKVHQKTAFGNKPHAKKKLLKLLKLKNQSNLADTWPAKKSSIISENPTKKDKASTISTDVIGNEVDRVDPVGKVNVSRSHTDNFDAKLQNFTTPNPKVKIYSTPRSASLVRLDLVAQASSNYNVAGTRGRLIKGSQKPLNNNDDDIGDSKLYNGNIRKKEFVKSKRAGFKLKRKPGSKNSISAPSFKEAAGNNNLKYTKRNKNRDTWITKLKSKPLNKATAKNQKQKHSKSYTVPLPIYEESSYSILPYEEDNLNTNSELKPVLNRYNSEYKPLSPVRRNGRVNNIEYVETSNSDKKFNLLSKPETKNISITSLRKIPKPKRRQNFGGSYKGPYHEEFHYKRPIREKSNKNIKENTKNGKGGQNVPSRETNINNQINNNIRRNDDYEFEFEEDPHDYSQEDAAEATKKHLDYEDYPIDYSDESEEDHSEKNYDDSYEDSEEKDDRTRQPHPNAIQNVDDRQHKEKQSTAHRRGKGTEVNPHNHHNQQTDEPKKSNGSPNPQMTVNPVLLYMASASGQQSRSPLMALPDTQSFPVFEHFGDFGKFA